MQQPIDIKGVLYGKFKTYDVIDSDLFERQIQDKDMVVMSNCNFCRPLIGLARKYNKPNSLQCQK